MKAMFTLLLAALFAGCASSQSRVTSWRAPELTPERVTKAGSVWVLADATATPAHGAAADPAKAALVHAAEDALRAKGFRVVPGRGGASYVFQFATKQTTRPSINSTFDRNDLFSQPIYIRQVLGQFSSLQSNGALDKVLWHGEARTSGFRFEEQKVDSDLMSKLLERFPK